MSDPYRSLLVALLPICGCTGKADDTADTSETGDTGETATTSEYGCYSVEASVKACPDPGDVLPADIIPETCGAEVVSVDGKGELGDSCGWIGGLKPQSWCIYPISVIPPDEPCDYGRPLVLDGAAQLAAAVVREDWARATHRPAEPDRARAGVWARVGLAEHASVGSFAKLALELLALGAPAALVDEAHAAARDEVRHARLAFGLAARAGGTPVGPGPLPMPRVELATDLVQLALATFRDGCVAETTSALRCAEARDLVSDEAEFAVLAVLAADEARHAAYAWKLLRWALEEGGEPVRAALVAALAEEGRTVATAADGGDGLLPAELNRRSALRAWKEVVVPAADALLAEHPAAAARPASGATPRGLRPHV